MLSTPASHARRHPTTFDARWRRTTFGVSCIRPPRCATACFYDEVKSCRSVNFTNAKT